ncbi:MAG: LysM peptidoglycan-binding domain-containing protein [Sulfurovum sp.]|nr:LysM peptidoglycan-binding domain-containing protein [Sulfurovum sp.]
MKNIYTLLFTCYVFTLGLHAKTVTHAVENGETLFTIAKLYHSTSADIQEENALAKDEMLSIGRILNIPINTYFPSPKKLMTLAKGIKSLYTHTPLVTHTVEDGETLFIIAKAYHTTSSAIQKENALGKDAMLSIGDVLNVPIDTYFPIEKKHVTLLKGAKSLYTKTPLVTHRVSDGETLFIIAKQYHSTSSEIQRENALATDTMLTIGDVLKVPINTYFPKAKKPITLVKGAKSQYSDATLVTHVIKGGETLFTIARAHRTTMDEVIRENSLKSNEMLKLGRVLIVPINTYDRVQKKVLRFKKYNSPKVGKIKIVKHPIKAGETLFIIARKYHSSIADIENKNHLKTDEVLKIGRVLNVPKNSYTSKRVVSIKKSKKQKPKIKMAKHRIKKRETLFTIARKHHTTISAVRKANGLKRGDILKVGKILNVPTNTYKAPNRRLAKNTKKPLKTYRYKRSTTRRITRGKITTVAKTKLGRRYVWGATGKRNTFDCSGFTKYVYKKNGITIPRTSINQSKFGKYVPRNKLKKGDLIFFDTSRRRKGYVNHVGIYIGNGKFIHASSAKRKVVITKLSKFYLKRYRGARRPS